MRTRARALIGSLALFVASSLAATALADLQSALTAMACCAKTNYQCAAGLGGPDDCCQRMGHTAGRITAVTLSSADPLFVPAAGIIPPFIVEPASAPAPLNPGPVFKRPHDPPHLHPYSLLI